MYFFSLRTGMKMTPDKTMEFGDLENGALVCYKLRRSDATHCGYVVGGAYGVELNGKRTNAVMIAYGSGTVETIDWDDVVHILWECEKYYPPQA
jgi:hypothetical protein